MKFKFIVLFLSTYRCRHLVICNYFGDISMKPCETMCDVCTQREFVASNIQTLKVNLSFIFYFSK